MNDKIICISVILCFLLTSCSRSYKPIEYGEQACEHCKMTIFDPRFAAELIDEKGKVFKFDDIICLKQFETEHEMTDKDLLLFVEQYNDDINNVIDARTAIYLRDEFFASPMNGNCAAFDNMEIAKKYADSLSIDVLNWNDIN